jgi:hypothetical protein
MLVRRDAAGVRLFTRNGQDWTGRFPLIARTAKALGLEVPDKLLALAKEAEVQMYRLRERKRSQRDNLRRHF